MFAALRRLREDREGSVLVEGTILVPVLVTLFLGVFEFSWYFFSQQLVEMGVRDAARYLARVELTGTNTPCTQTDPDTGNLYEDEAANIAATGQRDSGGTARVKGWTAAKVAITCLTSPALGGGSVYADGQSSMTIIYVTTTFADPTLGLFPALGLTTPSLSFTHQERYIGG